MVAAEGAVCEKNERSVSGGWMDGTMGRSRAACSGYLSALQGAKTRIRFAAPYFLGNLTSSFVSTGGSEM